MPHEYSRDFKFVLAQRKPGCYHGNHDRLCNDVERHQENDGGRLGRGRDRGRPQDQLASGAMATASGRPVHHHDSLAGIATGRVLVAGSSCAYVADHDPDVGDHNSFAIDKNEV